MRREYLQFGLIAVLLLLLVALAWLQFSWQGRISDAEQSRLEKRVKDDSGRFAAEFEEGIQRAVFAQDLSEKGLFTENGIRFVKRYLDWSSKTKTPGLFESIFRIEDDIVHEFDPEKRVFIESDFPSGSDLIRKEIARNQISVRRHQDLILIPVHEEKESISELVITSSDNFASIDREQNIGRRGIKGYALIRINREALVEQLIKPLYKKYFSGSDGVRFDIAVEDSNEERVWESTEAFSGKADHVSTFFTMRPRNLFLFDTAGVITEEPSAGSSKKKVVFSEVFSSKIETRKKTGAIDENVTIDIKPRQPSGLEYVKMIAGEQINPSLWKLKVRHESGSLQSFVQSTRNQNLAISLGILSVLGVGLVFIAFNARRSRILAQRQVDFVSSVSHEFRTPLAVIYSAAENISDGVIGDPSKLKDYGGLIKREGSKLSSMVEQILAFAGANAKKRELKKEMLDLRDLIAEVIDEYQPLFEKDGFEFESEIAAVELQVLGDKESLLQAIRNLVANAMKYSNGTRWIRIRAYKDGENTAICVEDRGIGISPSDKKQIFEPFFRSKEVADEQISGNGLGLSLVKKIIDEHGGRIEVDSEKGFGTSFRLLIPEAIA